MDFNPPAETPRGEPRDNRPQPAITRPGQNQQVTATTAVDQRLSDAMAALTIGNRSPAEAPASSIQTTQNRAEEHGAQLEAPASQVRTRPFRPMNMVSSVWRTMREYPTPEERRQRMLAGVSVNYRGNPYLASNRSAYIPDNQNCSLWLEGLPADVTTHELLGAIDNVGRVFQSHIVRPSGQHATSAAKITFFEAAAAATLLHRCSGPGRNGLWVRDRFVTVVYNRQRVAEPAVPAEHTRVLLISGPVELVNVQHLANYFHRLFVYQVDEVITLVEGRVLGVVEWRFGSYRCQAQAAFEALNADPVFRGSNVAVRFDRDPCDWRS